MRSGRRVTTGLREGAVRAVPKAAVHREGSRLSARESSSQTPPTSPIATLQARHTRGGSNQHAVSPVRWRLPVGERRWLERGVSGCARHQSRPTSQPRAAWSAWRSMCACSLRADVTAFVTRVVPRAVSGQARSRAS